MIEERFVNLIEPTPNDGDNVIKIVWDIKRDGSYSHSYEQYYTKDTASQFLNDAGIENYNTYRYLFSE